MNTNFICSSVKMPLCAYRLTHLEGKKETESERERERIAFVVFAAQAMCFERLNKN